eukprot:scaffold111793_cov30-Phaeocystis_antarctica.AAC.1
MTEWLIGMAAGSKWPISLGGGTHQCQVSEGGPSVSPSKWPISPPGAGRASTGQATPPGRRLRSARN